MLTGFLAALRALDLDDLDSVPLASRLCWAAWRAGQALAYADAAYAARRRDLDDQRGAPDLPWGHPDFVLAAAVRSGVLTAGAGRADRPQPARRRPPGPDRRRAGISHAALCNRRKRAEKALTDAIRNGLLAD